MNVNDPLAHVVRMAETSLVSMETLEALESDPGAPAKPSRAERERLQTLAANWRKRAELGNAAREVLAALHEATDAFRVQTPQSVAIRRRAESQGQVQQTRAAAVTRALRACVPERFDQIERVASSLGAVLQPHAIQNEGVRTSSGIRYWPVEQGDPSSLFGLDTIHAAAGRLNQMRESATWAELEQVIVHPARLEFGATPGGRGRGVAAAAVAAVGVVAAVALGI